MRQKKKVAVIGLGYVGYPLACAITKSGKYEVVGCDHNNWKVKKIIQGKSPLDDATTLKNIGMVKFQASTNPEIIKNADFYIICVPTPIFKNHLPNLGPVKSATKTISRYLRKGQNVILESTVNPGVCRKIVLPILEKTGLKGKLDFGLAHCPERINPGDPHWNVLNIPRNVGALTEKNAQEIADFYRSFLKAKINLVSSLEIAEATKIIENTFRDINIAYVNELAQSFTVLGLDLVETIKAASNKPFCFLPHFPGCGVGGHCIPVDPYYLIRRAKQAGFNHKFLKMARLVNNSMPAFTVGLLKKAVQKLKLSKDKITIGLLGLSYKNNLGDLRESPALKIWQILKNNGFKVNVFDPYVRTKSTVQSLEDLLKKSQALIIATGHQEFIETDYLQYKNIKVIIDGRNCLDKNKYKKKLIYLGIGR